MRNARSPKPDPAAWRSDESLAPLDDWLRAPGVAYLSLDVFATTLARACEKPVDVFPRVGRLLAERGLLGRGVHPDEFAELRAEAERVAREKRNAAGGGFEVTLREVYDELGRARAVAGAPRDFAGAELDAEKEFCFANPLVLDLVRDASARGLTVLFVSDTYFSRGELTDLLRACGVPCSPARIYVSSDHRVGKAEGRLFREVLDDLRADPAAVVHVGDNYQADYQGAAAAGLRAVHYYDANDYTSEVASLEVQTADAATRRDLGAVGAARTIAQRQAGRVAREQSWFFRYGAFVMGPALSAFALWSARRFAEAGVRRVFALMREGELLGEMLSSAAASLGLEVEAAPCHASRQATLLPSIFELDEPTLRGFWWRKEPPTLARLAAAFNLTPDDVAWVGLPPDDPIEEEDQRRHVIEAFLSPALRHRAEYEASRARDRMVAYLQSLAPLGGPDPVGLIDLGWNATIQRSLQNILELSGIPTRLVGCYLGLTGRYTRHRLNGIDASAFFGPAFQSQDFLSTIIRSPEVLEQATNSNVGSTLGYDEDPEGNVSPVLGGFRCLPLEVRRRDALKEGIRTYHALATRLTRDNPGRADTFAATPRAAGALLKRLIDRPTRREAFDLGGLHHDDNFGSDNWREICGPDADHLLKQHGAAALAADHRVYWPQGTAARQFGPAEPARPESAPLPVTGHDAGAARVRVGWSCDGTTYLEQDGAQWAFLTGDTLEAETQVPPGARWLRLEPMAGTGMVHVERWALERLSRGRGAKGAHDVLPFVYHSENALRLDDEGKRWVAYRGGPRIYAALRPADGNDAAHYLMQVRLRIFPLVGEAQPAA